MTRTSPPLFPGISAFVIALAWAITTIYLTGSSQAYLAYGWMLFYGTPVLYGFIAGFLYTRVYMRSGSSRPGREALKMSLLVPAFACGILLLVAFEGLICLIMAAPLVFGGTLMGAGLGIGVAYLLPGRRSRAAAVSILLALYSGGLALEHTEAHSERWFQITSAIEIDAPRELVWENVVAFSELPEPEEWLFHTGVAYPLRARITGEGVGATRYCEFTTGPFVEPITVWDAPRRLRFDVISNPAPMRELSPWRHVHPPHLEGFFESRQGEFLLTELPGGGTRVEGTTWYRHGLEPAGYWRWWSDYVIHRIHLRVLRHIKHEAEAETK